MEFGVSSELRYAALEKSCNRIRLAHDSNYLVFVIDNSISPFSAPFGIASRFGILYDCNMKTYLLNEIELKWVRSIGRFANELSKRSND